MKKWTVAIEISVPDELENDLTQPIITRMVSNALEDRIGQCSFQIFETIAAPYGPQHPGGVFITESKCTCRPGSVFQDKKCVAQVHRP